MEDYLGFAHGISAGMAATTAWESLRCFLTGPALFAAGLALSWAIVHGVHLHHRRMRRRLHLHGSHR